MTWPATRAHGGSGSSAAWTSPGIAQVVDAILAPCASLLAAAAILLMGAARGEASLCWIATATCVLWVLHWLWLFLRGGDRVFRPESLLPLPFLAYAAWNCWAVSPTPWTGRAEILVWALGAMFFAIFLHHARRPWILAACGVILLSAVLLSVGIAILQSCSPDWAAWLPCGDLRVGDASFPRTQLSQYEGRASGTFGSPNNFAGMLLLTLPLLAALVLTRRFKMTFRFFLAYVAGILALGLALSASRGAILALVVTLPAWTFLFFPRGWHRTRAQVVGVAVAIVAVFAFAKGDSLVKQRFSKFIATGPNDRIEITPESSRPLMWRSSWAQFMSAPATGTGAGSFDLMFEGNRPKALQRQAEHTHNDYLNVLGDLGAIGLGLILLPIGWLAWRSIRTWRTLPHEVAAKSDFSLRTPSAKAIGGGLAAGLAAFALHEFTDFHMKVPALVLLASIAIALPVRLLNKGFWIVPSSLPARLGIAATVLALATATGGLCLHTFLAEHRVSTARQVLNLAADGKLDAARIDAIAPALRDLLDGAAQLDDENPWPHQYRARLAIIQGSRATEDAERSRLAAEASAGADAALARCPAIWNFHVSKGQSILLAEPDDTAKALPHFERAAELAPRNYQALLYLADAQSRDFAHHDTAIATARRVLELDPDNSQAAAIIKRLEPAKLPRFEF